MKHHVHIVLRIFFLLLLRRIPPVLAVVKVIHLHDTALWSLDNKHGYNNVSRLHNIQVPSYALEVLVDRGILSDPLFRYNERQYRWVAHDTWTFVASWHLPSTAKRFMQRLDGAILCLDGVDTAADVYLNGVWLGTTANSHRKHFFNVANVLVENENTLEVRIYSAIEYSINAANRYPYQIPHMQQLGSIGKYNFIRKAASDFGWDWGPAFAPAGLGGNISLFLRDEALMVDVGIGQEHHSNGSILVSIDCFFLPTLNFEEGRLEVKVSAAGEPFDGLEISNTKISYKSGLHAVFPKTKGPRFTSRIPFMGDIEKENFQLFFSDLVRQTVQLHFSPSSAVKLWWPWDLALERNMTPASALYRATVTYEPSGALSHRKKATKTQVMERKFGFRIVTLERKPLVDGETFQVLINGVPVYARGANVVPMDIIETKVDSSKIKDMVGTSRAANMNMLRVWGGGRYFKDAFYNEMDEAGLLVWQEFGFACAMYPRDGSFLREVQEEVEQQSVRLMHHPSVVVWGGNNENEAAFEWFVESRQNPKLYAVDYVKLFVDTIRESLMSVNPQAVYVDSSPSNSIIHVPANHFDSKTRQDRLQLYVKRWGDVSNASLGDVHYYNYRDDLLDEGNFPEARFVSEFGYLSLASLGAYSKQTSQPLDWSVHSDMLRYRMRHGGGMEELKEQIKAQYGCSPDQKTEAPPSIVFTARTPPCAAIVGIVDAGQGSRGNPSSEVDEFQAFVYLTQLQQALVYSTAASKWRTGKASFANAGFLYWQLNDVWAGPSWSSINYDGSWRALHYAASKFFAPLMVFGKLKILENCSSHCALGTLDALDVWLVNDFSTNVQGSLTVQVIDYMAKSLDDVIVLLSNYSVEAQALNATLAWQWERVVDRKVQRPSINKSFVKLEFCPHTISTEAGNCAVQYLASTKLQEFESGDTRLKVESVQSCHYNSKKNDNRCFSLVLGATGGIAPWVLLESTVPGTFSDNLLFVVPWDQTRVEFHVSSSVTSLPGVREMEESLRITWLRGSHAAMSPDHHNKVQSRNWFVTWM